MVGAGGFADKAVGHLFIVGGHPVQQSSGSVESVRLFIASDREDHGTIGRGFGDEIAGGSDEGRDAGFHIGGPASPQEAVLNFRTEGVDGPVTRVADGHDVGVTIEAKAAVRAFPAPAGKQVCDTAAVNAGAVKAVFRQKLFQQDQRAAL